MKKLLKVTAPGLAIIFLAACGNNAANKGNAEDSGSHHGHDHGSMNDKAAAAVVKLKDDKLNAVYRQYELLTKALTDGDASAARIAGNAIEAGASEVAGGNAIGAAAAKITSAADIDAQRAAYSTLSNELISLVKESGVGSGALYVDFCPMALNDKGAYWLSANKEIRNPYFGEKMMTCGEVKDSIQ